MTKSLPKPDRLWTWAAAGVLVTLVVSRNVYYGPVPLPEPADRWLQRALVAETFSAILAMWADAALVLSVLTVGVALLLFRRRWVFRREGELWGVRPWLYGLAWLVIVVNHPFYDVNSYLAVVCLSSLPMIGWGGRRLARDGAVLAAAGLLAIALAPDAVDRLSVAAWTLVVALFASVGARTLTRRDRLTLALLFVPAVQVSPAYLAKDLVLHEGIRVGEGMAYAYCESPSRGEIFAMVPNCGTAWSRIEECRDAVVEVIDVRAPSEVERYRIFGDDYYGRIEEPVCLENTIQIGMNRTLFHGERQLESALELSMDDPTRVRAQLLGEAGGHRIVYDPRDDVLFYLGDDVRRVYRYERATAQMTRWEATGPASERIVSAAIHPRRRTLFTVSVDGPVRELRLEDLSLVRTYRHGGGTEIAVDARRDRLIVTGFFGLEAIDIDDGRSLLRRRLGFLPRRPTLDEKNGLAYLSVFGSGKLVVLDLETLEPLKQIPVGVGGRYPYVSRDGEWLFAGSEEAHFAWRIPEWGLGLERGDGSKRR